MAHAYLISGGNGVERNKEAEKIVQAALGQMSDLDSPNHPDLLVVSGSPSIGIDQIKQLAASLALKPFQAKTKVVVIVSAQALTLAAQNALLKTLEEPPGDSIIILTVPQEEALVPTIRSRCQQVRLSPKPEIILSGEEVGNEGQLCQEILTASSGERILLLSDWAEDRQGAITFCQRQLVFWRQLLRAEGIKMGLTLVQIVTTIRLISHSLELLSANVNPRLTLENLVLDYPKSKT